MTIRTTALFRSARILKISWTLDTCCLSDFRGNLSETHKVGTTNSGNRRPRRNSSEAVFHILLSFSNRAVSSNTV